MLVSVGCCEKIEKFVYNACLLNYYCYLCGKLRKKLRMLRHGASQGNPKGLPCCHFIKSPSTSNGLTSPLSYIHTSFIALGDCLCRAMICLRINLSEHPFVLFITIWSDCSIPCESIRPTFFLLHGLTKPLYSMPSTEKSGHLWQHRKNRQVWRR